MTTLRSAFSTGVERDGDVVRLRIEGERLAVDRETAERLRAALGEALAGRREFRRTAGEHRPDGSYVVARRGVDSPGNRAVFDSFGDLRRLYERLPGRFDAAAVGATAGDVTGSRRHMVLRHLAEHPVFDCELTSRSPLVVEKRSAAEPGRQ